MSVILPTVLRLEFTSTDIIVAEADGSTAVGVIKQGRNERPVTVDFSTQNGTATGISFFFGRPDTIRIIFRILDA